MSTAVLFAIGLLLIIAGGDRFVDSAVNIARRLGVSEILIGATIVSLGTTLPEVLVSTTAGLSGSADIAAGNAFGSIICNTSLIAGLTQLFAPSAEVDAKGMGWRVLFFYGAGAVCLAFGLGRGVFGFSAGIILLSLFGLYAYLNISLSHLSSKPPAPAVSSGKEPPLIRQFVILAFTAAMLYFGARLLVSNGIVIAAALGVPERVIAVTFIALGTSLPELVTAVTSIVKGHTAVSVGNIIGANTLNFLLVMGIPSVLSGVAPSMSSFTVDLPLALAVMALLTVPMLIMKRGSRLQGALLVAGYAAYCIYQF